VNGSGYNPAARVTNSAAPRTMAWGAAHERRWGVAGLFEPSVDDHAEIVVERGNDIERGENREHGMMRFDEREEK